MKKALVTGGNRGIGKAIVEKLSESHEVYFTFKSGEKSAADVCSAISQKGGKARAFRLDLNNAEETQSIIAAEVKASGGFDVVVHNAGAASDTPLPRRVPAEATSTGAGSSGLPTLQRSTTSSPASR